MIHFLPLQSEAEAAPEHRELVSRLSGLKHALRLVDPFGGGPASDFDPDLDSAAFAGATPEMARCFDSRSERVVGAAAAGLEAIADTRTCGLEPSSASLDCLAKEIRAGLADLSSLLRS